MSSGYFHSNVAKFASFTTSIAMLSAFSPEAACFQIGMTIGNLITPDLDHHVKTHEETRLLKFNEKLGRAWILISKPYSKLFSHRGVSHWHIIGTITRIPYGALLFLPVFLLTYTYFSLDLSSQLIYIFLGWTLQDSIHVITDFLYSSMKKTKTGKRKRRFTRRKRR